MTDFAGKVREANKLGWFLLNCFQMPEGYRVNLQMRKPNGASTDFFTEFADAETPDDALDAAIKNARARMPHIRQEASERAPRFPGKATEELTPQQERRLVKALDALWLAIKFDNGARGEDREDSL